MLSRTSQQLSKHIKYGSVIPLRISFVEAHTGEKARVSSVPIIPARASNNTEKVPLPKFNLEEPPRARLMEYSRLTLTCLTI